MNNSWIIRGNSCLKIILFDLLRFCWISARQRTLIFSLLRREIIQNRSKSLYIICQIWQISARQGTHLI